MSILTRIVFPFFLALMIGCATGPSGPSSESYDSPSGQWSKKWENSSREIKTSRLTIFDEMSAQYTGSNNTRVEFYSTDDPFTWKGYWIGAGHTYCSEEKGGINSWGEQIFHFNETYTGYEGAWDYCGQGRKFSTSGVR